MLSPNDLASTLNAQLAYSAKVQQALQDKRHDDVATPDTGKPLPTVPSLMNVPFANYPMTTPRYQPYQVRVL